MKPKFYLFILINCILVLCLNISCEKNDDIYDEEMELVFDTQSGNTDFVEENMDSLIYNRQINHIQYIDTTGNGKIEYKSAFGMPIYPEYPNYYYIGAENVEKAEDIFREIIVEICARDSIKQMSNGDLILNTTGGNLTFHVDNNGNQLATVNVNLKDVKQIKKYIFINQEEWPTNDSSPIKIGELWRRDNGWYYICVHTWNGLGPTKLITLDGGWSDVTLNKYQKIYKKVLELKDNCASEIALKQLIYLSYNGKEIQKVLKRKVLERIINDDPNANESPTFKLLTGVSLYNYPTDVIDKLFYIDKLNISNHRYTFLDKLHYKIEYNYIYFKYNDEAKFHKACCGKHKNIFKYTIYFPLTGGMGSSEISIRPEDIESIQFKDSSFVIGNSTFRRVAQ